MSKVTMPEPVAHAVTNKRHPKASIALHHDASFAVGDDDLLIEDLITTTQAEAYAAAKARAALEEAEAILTGMYTDAVKARVPEAEDEQGWNASCADRAIAIGEAVLAIRALIPQQ